MRLQRGVIHGPGGGAGDPGQFRLGDLEVVPALPRSADDWAYAVKASTTSRVPVVPRSKAAMAAVAQRRASLSASVKGLGPEQRRHELAVDLRHLQPDGRLEQPLLRPELVQLRPGLLQLRLLRRDVEGAAHTSPTPAARWL